ncbi:hypothetical protein SHIRM173S_10122 [Streptomyces hirsutus]
MSQRAGEDYHLLLLPRAGVPGGEEFPGNLSGQVLGDPPHPRVVRGSCRRGEPESCPGVENEAFHFGPCTPTSPDPGLPPRQDRFLDRPGPAQDQAGDAVRSDAEEGCSVVLVKDTYGVAGRGTFEVTSQRRLVRLAKHLRGQEEEGLRVEFVVQPRCDREVDFSSHLRIDPDGSWQLLGVQSLVNAGYRHEVSGAAFSALTSTPRSPTHGEVVDTVARELAREGYFGPVCIDSMTLRDGS